MPIYITVEVARRELEGRLLLGLVAAERGHDVVLGKIPHRALLTGELDGWRLPPGILHLKSIASSERIYERFDRMRSDGMLITVQDEEHGLAGPSDYEEFGQIRFPVDAVRRADLILAWGPHDGDWLASTFSAQGTPIRAVGSPRIDLWRPEVIGSAADEGGGREPHILIVSSVTPFARNPFWVSVYQTRHGAFGPAFEGDDDTQEFLAYDGASAAFLHVKHVVRAVRRLAKRFPSTPLVFRPHHFEEPAVWPALIGEYPNLRFDIESTSRSLVENASAVIHRGSSMALEATVAARRIVTFCPEQGPWDDWTSNRFGTRVGSVEQLTETIDSQMLSGTGRARPSADQALLESLLASLDGPLAADRIVDEWERMMTPATSGRVERIVRRPSIRAAVGLPLRVVRDAVRRGPSEADSGRTDKGPFAMEVEHKFPSLDVDALRKDAQRLANHLGRFKDVEIVRIGEREVLLRAAGR